MSAAHALLAEQPVAFWLAVTGVLLAVAVAAGRRLAVRVALAALPGAAVASLVPHAAWAQAAAAVLGVGAALGVAVARRLAGRHDVAAAPARPPAPPDGAGPDEARLLGRTARTRGPFVAGEGEVEVEGRRRAARALAPDEYLDGGVLVRIVRVGEAALVVRPVSPAAV